MTTVLIVIFGLTVLLVAVAVLGLFAGIAEQKRYEAERLHRAQVFAAAHPEFKDRLIADGFLPPAVTP